MSSQEISERIHELLTDVLDFHDKVDEVEAFGTQLSEGNLGEASQYTPYTEEELSNKLEELKQRAEEVNEDSEVFNIEVLSDDKGYKGQKARKSSQSGCHCGSSSDEVKGELLGKQYGYFGASGYTKDMDREE